MNFYPHLPPKRLKFWQLYHMWSALKLACCCRCLCAVRVVCVCVCFGAGIVVPLGCPCKVCAVISMGTLVDVPAKLGVCRIATGQAKKPACRSISSWMSTFLHGCRNLDAWTNLYLDFTIWSELSFRTALWAPA